MTKRMKTMTATAGCSSTFHTCTTTAVSLTLLTTLSKRPRTSSQNRSTKMLTTTSSNKCCKVAAKTSTMKLIRMVKVQT